VLLLKRSWLESSVRVSGDEFSEMAERTARPLDNDSIKFLETSIIVPQCGIEYYFLYTFLTLSSKILEGGKG